MNVLGKLLLWRPHFAQALARKLVRTGETRQRLQFLVGSLLDAVTFGRGVVIPLAGVPFRVDPRFARGLRLNEEADTDVAGFLRRRVRPGAVCFNVGASVGLYTLTLAQLSAPDGAVVAFEPNPATAAVLRKHLRLNGLAERVRVVEAAVSDLDGSTTFYAAENHVLSRLGRPNAVVGRHARPLTVPVHTLDTWCGQANLQPDCLFVDVEGYEMSVLRGARGLIRRRAPHLGIVVEFHPELWSDSETSPAEVAALLGELGLRPVPLQGQRDPLAEHGAVHLVPAERPESTGWTSNG